MKAYLIKPEYPDLEPGRPYHIKRVYDDKHITLVGSPRKYDIRSFKITYKGKQISYREAYKRYCINKALRGER